MTTAARPTFEPARGGSGKGEKDLSALSKQYSSRDLPSHTKLKYREHGQGTSEEIKGRDFKRDLETREKAIARSEKRTEKPERLDVAESSSTKRPRIEQPPTGNLDADDPLDADDSDQDDDSDEDDTAQLMAELQRIKKERAQEETRKEFEKKQEDEKIRMENILSGNPLLNYSAGANQKADLRVKRRWDDDVVFKNCAKGDLDKKQPQFINDSLRSEFHKKFMEKYIK